MPYDYDGFVPGYLIVRDHKDLYNEIKSDMEKETNTDRKAELAAALHSAAYFLDRVKRKYGW